MDESQNIDFFNKLLVPTLIFALLTVICIYNNFSGILSLVSVIITEIFCSYIFKVYEIKMKKATFLYMAGMLLLGLSSFLTGKAGYIMFNTLGILLLLLCMLIHNFYDDALWSLSKHLMVWGKIFVSFMESLAAPFVDISTYTRANKDKKSLKNLYIIIGIVISIPLLMIVVSLLYSADAVFAQVLKSIFKDINVLTIIGWIIFFVFIFMVAYCGIRALACTTFTKEDLNLRKFEPVIAITVSTILTVVYLAFSLIQVGALFMGSLKLPEGYTYAEYAREGFFQLLAVCILNMVIVLFIRGFFRESKALKGILTIMTACTYIMIASSAMRMVLYINTYALTTLRILVLWALAVLSFVFAGIIIDMYVKRFSLFKYCLLVVSVFYIGLSLCHTDYIIADYNLAEAEKGKDVDWHYLEKLSTDAAPVIAAYEGQANANFGKLYFSRINNMKTDSIRQFNLSHFEASRANLNSYIGKSVSLVTIKNDTGEEILEPDLLIKEGDKYLDTVIDYTKSGENYDFYVDYDKLKEQNPDWNNISVAIHFKDENGNIKTSDENYVYFEVGSTDAEILICEDGTYYIYSADYVD